LIGNFFDQTLKFDRFIDILSHQTRVKFLDRIYTSNPINKVSNVWSGVGLAALAIINKSIHVYIGSI
jgi:hypothetical protein